MKKWHRTIFFTCGLLFGIVYGQQSTKPQAYPVGKISTLQQTLLSFSERQHLFTPGDPNCVIPDGQLEVQKLWIQDQPGGDLTTSLPSGGAAKPSDLAKDINGSFRSLEGNTPVTILIVDDFHTKLRVKGKKTPINLTHGQLIKSQIDLILKGLNKPRIAAIKTDFLDFVNQYSPESTNSLSQRIQVKIDQIRKDTGISHIVVNMSFAVLSCKVLDDYNRWLRSQTAQINQRISFEGYAEEVLKASYPTWSAQSRRNATTDAIAALFTPNGSDPLEPNSSSEHSIVWVAAAGNYALHFPLFPAAWSKVVGVAAAKDYSGADALAHVRNATEWTAWSNWGDVKERGQWFQTDLTGKPLYYYGTSFATPLASLLLALSISEKGSPCPITDYGSSPLISVKSLRDELADMNCLH